MKSQLILWDHECQNSISNRTAVEIFQSGPNWLTYRRPTLPNTCSHAAIMAKNTFSFDQHQIWFHFMHKCESPNTRLAGGDVLIFCCHILWQRRHLNFPSHCKIYDISRGISLTDLLMRSSRPLLIFSISPRLSWVDLLSPSSFLLLFSSSPRWRRSCSSWYSNWTLQEAENIVCYEKIVDLQE